MKRQGNTLNAYYKVKEPVGKGYILSDANNGPFGTGQTVETFSSVAARGWEQRLEQGAHGGRFGQRNCCV